jgi:hypothetical protein
MKRLNDMTASCSGAIGTKVARLARKWRDWRDWRESGAIAGPEPGLWKSAHLVMVEGLFPAAEVFSYLPLAQVVQVAAYTQRPRVTS